MLLLRALPTRMYNAIIKKMWPVYRPTSSLPELKEIQDRAAQTPSDISDHLPTIFSEALAVQPRLMVELGVRGGESRFALERVAQVTGAFLVSVDLDDCCAACTESPRWPFVRSDDIQFAKTFGDWCTQRHIEPRIDVLFIDTSHLYDHTVQEIDAWFPYLSDDCKVIFHDTNIKRFYRRLDGTIEPGWNNDRGVIRAIEEHLGTRLNERIDFVTIVHEWLIRHWSHCSGLTTMERVRRSPQSVSDSRSAVRCDHTPAVTLP